MCSPAKLRDFTPADESLETEHKQCNSYVPAGVLAWVNFLNMVFGKLNEVLVKVFFILYFSHNYPLLFPLKK